MKKLKGYTLTEVMLVLVLGAVVSGMGYLGLELIMKQFYLSKNKDQESIEYHQGIARFKKDFFAAEPVTVEGDRLRMHYPNRMIDYIFADELLIRTDVLTDVSDTILFSILEAKYFDNGQPQFILGTPIDSIEIALDIKGEEEILIVKKKRFAKDKMKQLGY